MGDFHEMILFNECHPQKIETKSEGFKKNMENS